MSSSRAGAVLTGTISVSNAIGTYTCSEPRAALLVLTLACPLRKTADAYYGKNTKMYAARQAPNSPVDLSTRRSRLFFRLAARRLSTA